MIKVGTIAKQE